MIKKTCDNCKEDMPLNSGYQIDYEVIGDPNLGVVKKTWHSCDKAGCKSQLVTSLVYGWKKDSVVKYTVFNLQSDKTN